MKAGDLIITADGVEVEILDIHLDGMWVSDADCNESFLTLDDLNEMELGESKHWV